MIEYVWLLQNLVLSGTCGLLSAWDWPPCCSGFLASVLPFFCFGPLGGSTGSFHQCLLWFSAEPKFIWNYCVVSLQLLCCLLWFPWCSVSLRLWLGLLARWKRGSNAFLGSQPLFFLLSLRPQWVSDVPVAVCGLTSVSGLFLVAPFSSVGLRHHTTHA